MYVPVGGDCWKAALLNVTVTLTEANLSTYLYGYLFVCACLAVCICTYRLRAYVHYIDSLIRFTSLAFSAATASAYDARYLIPGASTKRRKAVVFDLDPDHSFHRWPE